ncbi:S9 family peptidase [Gryllotalpicola kribbensis]|uniref:S9 family peptidase n=1 Tax=Gryllotalpicola kribbensis TaxID=993084 RepID=A0ABP8AEN4_9MICO
MTDSADRNIFADLDRYVAQPRVSGLALSPDGTRLVTGVQTLNPDRTGYSTALWQVDPSGEAPARRLTRSAKGEASAVFTPGGDLLFTSARPDPDTKGDDDPKPALWLLPAGGGEARVIATAPGGIGSPLVARDADIVSVAAELLPSAVDLKHDGELRKARDEGKVSAILHTGYPVRYWDEDLGPAETRRFAASLAELSDAPATPLPAAEGDDAPEPAGRLTLRQLTGAGRGLNDGGELTPDGATLVAVLDVPAPGAAQRSTLIAIDTATGERRVLVDDPGYDVYDSAISPDGLWVAYTSETHSTPQSAPVVHLQLVPLAGGEPRVIAADWDRWPGEIVWLPDSSALLVTADEDGRAPVFLISGVTEAPAEARVERVTADAAAFHNLQLTRDGSALYALRTSYAAPDAPVRLDLAAFLAGEAGSRHPIAAQELRSPVAAPELPGTLTEIETVAADGSRVRAWLALPEGASAEKPAPLLLWIHGGPLGSWNTWSWRWNPWLMVAEGYAVLLPDPALSTGYGQEFIQRGWGAWGQAPFTDLMSITDTAVARSDIDETRTAAMGGSFGGYMANWVAGHTDRFRAIVTHASLWALDQFGPTTDAAWYWQRELSPEAALANSPHLSVEKIVTPMLVVHGDRDYRVPIGEGLRLWYELLSKSGSPAADDGSTDHRFLYFPDENHWVLSPQHAKVWYQVVLAFLAKHVLGEERELPATLG